MISIYNLVFLLIMGVGSILFSIMVSLAYFTKSVDYVLKNKLYIIFLIITFLLEAVEIVLSLIYGFSNSIELLYFGIKLYWSFVYIWDVFLLLYCLYYYMGIDKEDHKKFRELFKINTFKIYIIISILGLILLCFIPIGSVSFNYFMISSGNVPRFVMLLHLLAIFIVVMYMIFTRKDASIDSFGMIIFNLFMSLLFTVVQLVIPFAAVFTVTDVVILAALYLFFENPDLYTINEIKEANELANKSKSSKTEVLVNISHDLKSPMNTIIQLTDEVLKSNEDNKDKIEENIRLINISGHNLMNTLNSIIENSKLDGDSDKLNENDYSLKSMLFDLSEIMNAKVDQKPVKFIMNVDNTTPDMLFGDSVKIYQLLSNLLSNAVKNTDVGKIALILEKEMNESNVLLKFKIVDSGTGIDENISSELATELKESSDSKKIEKESENKGMGLKIAKKYVDLMNGKIWFDSRYGAGTTFFVEIPQTIVSMTPMGDIRSSDEDITKKELADYSKYKVLVVDDDYQSMQISTRLLSRYKFNIDTCKSKQECLYKIKRGEEFDIIFIEPLVADANDAEVIRLIKKVQALYKQSLIIALSSNNNSSARYNYMNEGADAFLSKPINLQELDNVLIDCLSDNKSNNTNKAE